MVLTQPVTVSLGLLSLVSLAGAPSWDLHCGYLHPIEHTVSFVLLHLFLRQFLAVCKPATRCISPVGMLDTAFESEF